jgi:DHA1 family bicyclomycin/chloramphenicol resistance-like MFS transporter
MPATPPPASPRHEGMSFRAFVVLIASLMAVHAFSIDVMLPALPAIGDTLGIAEPNARQWIITAYVIGFGAAQIVYGPLADRYGRRPVLLASLVLYIIMSVVAGAATGFATMFAARLIQGVAAAGSRVVSVALVRDCYEGRRMARVTSLAFMVFLTIPILAPSIGQLIIMVAPWRWIFWMLAGFGALIALIAALRLPETLLPSERRSLSVSRLGRAFGHVLSNRSSIGYTLGMTVMWGSMMGFITSSQQIFDVTFAAADLFPILFAACAGTMALGAWLNSRIVERFGTRRVSQTALIAFILISAVHIAIVLAGVETLASFSIAQALLMAALTLTSSNFGAMAMEEMGGKAGTASSLQGFIQTLGGAAVGASIGLRFDGTTLPLSTGYLLSGLAAFVSTLWVERGRLFRPHHAPPVQ